MLKKILIKSLISQLYTLFYLVFLPIKLLAKFNYDSDDVFCKSLIYTKDEKLMLFGSWLKDKSFNSKTPSWKNYEIQYLKTCNELINKAIEQHRNQSIKPTTDQNLF